ncbi:class I SAM-dependent methyltransferase [Pandoraea sputorum]|uniref:SAM-dependent methyltransferase n=1 Tax=Pandoraea sputorum TaxID=93222 RepID=A0A5E5BG82_9BURK|nr:class I SAM-dependent methyltransferase [Pandoraea sputorum]VVE84724.1 SAM-dependent methyltransferase [Pandoraea sputorum]
MAPDNKLLEEVATYYSGKLAEHGETPRGVDWNSEAGQTARFTQLVKLLPPQDDFLIQDIGCGYGALYEFLSTRYDTFAYRGIDVSEAMLRSARARLGTAKNIEFKATLDKGDFADFSVASGIFNVKLNRSDEEWRDYVEQTLERMAETSRKGFAFNCLTSYSDAEYMRADLFYADPCRLFDFCKRKFSRNVALLHDYELYEFTILVKI